MSRWFSLARSLVWVVLIPLSKILGWIDSVAFVALCSLYANAASDYAAYRADSNPRLERIEESICRMEEAVARIEAHLTERRAA